MIGFNCYRCATDCGDDISPKWVFGSPGTRIVVCVECAEDLRKAQYPKSPEYVYGKRPMFFFKDSLMAIWLGNNPKVIPTVTPPSEFPCRNCSRMNDIGVRKCWHCECERPNA